MNPFSQFWELGHFSPFLLAGLVSITILALFFVARSAFRHPREVGPTELVRELQAVWRSPILKDNAFARRIVEIISAPIVKENYQLSLQIEGDYGSGIDDAAVIADIQAIRVHVKAQFAFRNLTDKAFVLCFPVAPEDQAQSTLGVVEVVIDGVTVPLTSDDGRDIFELEMPARGKRQVALSSVYAGRLPFIANFSHGSAVLSDAEISLISHVYDRIGLQVTGCDKYFFYEDWRGERTPLEKKLTISQPMFPGESIQLLVGI